MGAVDKEALAYLVHHLVLPPKVPQKDDSTASNERALLETTSEALRKFGSAIQAEHAGLAPQVESATSMINNLLRSRDSGGHVSEAQLAVLLHSLATGRTLDAVPLEIKAQNAGIIVSRREDDVIFELFELSPPNQSVMTTKGRLTRSFPTYAYRIPIEQFREEGLIGSLAQAIAKMSSQVAPGFQPLIQKVGKSHAEIRDTTHPGLITDYLANFLCANGQPMDAGGIWKNTREEVLWSNAKMPWRRSPLWLLVRVSLQLQFDRCANNSDPTKALYKPFMVYLLGHILDLAGGHHNPASSDLLFATSAKLTRRIRKLESHAQSESSSANWMKFAHITLSRAYELMDTRWKDIMNNTSSNVNTAVLNTLEPEKDLDVCLSGLDNFVGRIAAREQLSGASQFRPSLTYPDFAPDELPNGFRESGEYVYFQLAAVEKWVENHLSSWLDLHGEEESTCDGLRELIEAYHYAAKSAYANMPRSISVMYLCLLELWVACDKSARHIHPLLDDFDPEVQLESLAALSLPLKSHLQRLAQVERYVRDRRNAAKRHSPSVFRNFGHASSFAVKFFDRSSELEELHLCIEQAATEDCLKKRQELASKQEQYRDLMRKYDESVCEYREVITNHYHGYTETQHDPYCRKCRFRQEAEGIGIRVYEWPLSSDASIAKATLFELQIPPAFSNWRDVTLFVMMNVLGFVRSRDQRPRASYKLSGHQDLSNFSSGPYGQRIILLSQVKPHTGTHRKLKNGVSTLKEENVCLDNALRYQYYDSSDGVFTDSLHSTDRVSKNCTYQLPGRSSNLQQYVRPLAADVPPNKVIADLSDCPTHISIDEYKAFGALPLGYNVQYINILTQLAMPTVDFAKAETQCLILQTTHRTGPPSEDDCIERLSHRILAVESFGQAMIKELDSALQRVTENWESWRAVASFVQLSLRLLSFTSSSEVKSRCLSYLASVRQICLGWLDTIMQRLHVSTDDGQRVELCSRATEIALLCISSFDVDEVHVNDVLCSPSATSALLQSSIIVQENKDTTSTEHDSLYRVMLQNWRSVLYRVFPTLASGILIRHLEGELNDAVTASWAAFRPSDNWTSYKTPWHQWMYVKCSTLDVHFNLLTAELLVQGLPLARLPAEYLRHPVYPALFQRSSIEVMPTNEPGMDFSSKHAYRGHELSFGMEGSDMLVVAANANEKFDLLPSRLLKDLFPSSFVDDYFHWYNHHTGEIEFRPRAKPWSSTNQLWRLNRSGPSWRLVCGQYTLVNIDSNTARALARMFSPLENALHIHTKLDMSSLSVSIDIPRLQLGFYFGHRESLIHSRQYRGMIVDPDQRVGTLVGLSNKLVLKHTRDMDERLVVVPEGSITYQKALNHVVVCIDPDTAVKAHVYHLDHILGRATDNGSLQSRLYLCYLHALTSYCLPDSLTSHTGTEAALGILRSAAVRSFNLLRKQDIAVLDLIARLSPGRAYYPQNEQVMQEIDWDPNLPSLSQHPEFFVEVERIFNQAREARFFHAREDYVEPVKFNFMQPHLLQRDMIRSSIFRVDGFGAEHYSTQFDKVYQARARVSRLERGQRTFTAASLILREQGAPAFSIRALEHSFRNVHLKGATVHPPGRLPLKASLLKYDSDWLQEASTFVPKLWCDLHASLAKSPQNYNKFDIAMWLSTAAFAQAADMELIQALAALYKIREFSSIEIPPFTILQLSKGEAPTLSDIRNLIQTRKSFQVSPEFNLPQRPTETRKQYQQRRQKQFQSNQEKAVNSLARALEDQWPCEQPTRPSDAQAETYLDVSRVMQIAAPSFKAWYDNRCFWRYIQEFCTAFAQQQVVPVSVAQNEVVDPRKYAQGDESRRSFSVAKIFSLQAPITNSSNPNRMCGPTLPEAMCAENLSGGHSPRSTVVSDSSSEPQFQRSLDHDRYPQAKDRLSSLFEDLKLQARSKCEKAYISDLQDSCDSLAVQEAVPHGRVVGVNTAVRLEAHLADCRRYFHELNVLLENVVKSAHDVAARIQQSPRLSPTFWLQQLNRERYDTLSDDWKAVIIQYGLAITELHRAQRLLALSGHPQDLAEELRNCGHQNWDPAEYPETLLLEAESGIMVREVQEEIANQMRKPPSDQNAVMQLNMGEGKSSVIVPIVAAALADGWSLVRVIVAKPQSKQMFQMLVSKLGGLLNRRIYHMPFSRVLRLSADQAYTIDKIYRECMANRGILLVQPEHILSFKLMGIECLISGPTSTGPSLLRTQEFFDTKSRDIVDESDENFSVKFELVYTMGSQRPIELSPERWIIIDTLLGLLGRCALPVKEKFPHSIEFDDRWQGRFPRVRILQSDAEDMLFDLMARHICDVGFPGLPITRQPQCMRDAVYRYIRQAELATKDIDAVEKGPFWMESTKDALLLVRGLIACGVVRFALRSKRWRVNYGVDPNRSPKTTLAVPYRSKDCPSPRSEFSHPDVLIVFTSLTYYYGGLEDDDLFDTLAHLLKSDQADIEYAQWVRTAGLLPKAFHHLSGINIKDRYQCINQVFPSLRYSKGAIDYFLCHIVFPKEMKEFPYKLSASGWDIGQVKPKPTTGFSGTNDSRHVLPLSVHHLDLPKQKHTNALVLAHLLQDENSVKLLPPRTASVTSDAEHLLATVMAMDLSTRVILDVGAQILELNNYQVAEKWLSMSTDTTKAVVFFNDNEELSVLDRTGRVDLLQTSPFAKQLDACLIYLDEAHTRGTDLKLPRNYRAAVTLGANLTKDRLVQACMRLRKLGKGQSVVFCIPEEIQNKILECTSKRTAEEIGVSDVLVWAICETWADLRRSMPLWATQGRRFEEHKDLLHGANTTKEQAKQFLEDEAQSLEYRYRPRQRTSHEALLYEGWDTSNESISRILARCRDFETTNFDAATLQEEQERELSPEIEEERQIQRPAPMEPAKHVLEGDLVKLVETGEIAVDSKAFTPAFRALQSTTAAKHFGLAQFPTELLVTADYIRTVKPPSGLGNSSYTSDSYQRPVQWILSVPKPASRPGASVPTVGHLVILSPFEADQLLGKVQKFSKVTLHVYSPRSNLAYKPLDILQLYSVGRPFSPNTVPRSLIVQLNLFAGQLYFRSYEEYTELCDFLGLAWAAAKDGQVVQADGFVAPPNGKWGLKRSPVKFLREFFTKVRREGEGVGKTHLGKVLDGGLLEESDFE